ncbi:ATP-binding cassette domain-containing protein [Aminivibrio sp.]
MLEVKNISLTLRDDEGEIQVLKDVSFTLDDKKIYVMTGPNGGGKSVLAKTIMGIHHPTSGQILLDGVDITHKELYERARMGIGYAFQQPARFKGIKVRELLEIASGKSTSVDTCEYLYDVGLCAQDYLDREINASFSGGEVKRIEIATILARNLKLAIFDEPEAGIDLWSMQRLTETFDKMNKNFDTTILIISHQERILNLADEVIMVAEGTVSEITSREKVLGEISRLDSDCRCRRGCSRGGRAIAGCDR